MWRLAACLVALLLASAPAAAGYNDRSVAAAAAGHIASTGGNPTSVATCGTGSPSVSGTDTKGVITIGGGTVTACTLNFASPWSATPVCVANLSNATAIGVSAISTTAVTFAIASSGSAKLYYHCLQ